MTRLIAIAISAALILTGCASEPEGEADSTPVQDSQKVQSEQDTMQQKDEATSPAEASGGDEPLEAEKDSGGGSDQSQLLEEERLSKPEAQEESQAGSINVPGEDSEGPSFESTFLDYITDLNDCRLQQTNRTGYENKGFPYSSYIPATGVVKIALVAMDFENAVGSGSVPAKFGDIPSKLENWSKKWSFGKMTYDVQLHPEWIRAPRSAEWYNCPECHGQGERKQSDAESLAQIISAIDPHYDLTGIDFIGIIVPPQADEEFYFGIYGLKTASTNEGTQRFSIYGGLGITEKVSLWDLLIHEILHFQGFVGHGPGNGTEYGIMMMQWGRSKAINIWEGFLAGWYDQNEVACINSADVDDGLFAELGSIESFSSSYEGLIVRISDEEALVLEHRKVFGSELLAYRVNVNAPSYRDDMGGRPADERNWWSFILEGDGNIAVDESVSHAGLTVTHFGDGRFSISK